MTREQTLIWAAGFFDGEGCIYIGRRTNTGRPYYILTISVSNTDKATVEIFRKLFGGYISEISSGNRRNKLFMWQLDSAKAANALTELQPYLKSKSKEAKLANRFQSRRGKSNLEKDDRDWIAMKALKAERKVALA